MLKGFIGRLSPKRFAQTLLATCRRFPLPLLFVVAFTVTGFAFVDADANDHERTWFFLFFYTAGGGVLSLALKLWDETVNRRWFSYAVQAACHTLWFDASVYLSVIMAHEFDAAYFHSAVALCLLVVTVLFLLPFVRERTDQPLHTFVQRMAVWTAVAVIVAGLLTLGVSLLLLSFEKLFGLFIGSGYYYVFIACFGLIAPVLVLQQIPANDELHSTDAQRMSAFYVGVTHYLYVPLLFAYFATLYVYAAQILIRWQLPVGWVSSLVSWSMVGMLLLIFTLYPVQFVEGRRFDKALLRWLPVAVVPLLALMSVGLWRRIDDYGLTNARLYLVVFNVWCYAVAIGLAVIRSRRIAWVLASFAIIGVIVSVGPQSIANAIRRQMTSAITNNMASHGFTTLPLSYTEAKRWLDGLNPEEKNTMVSKLEYLRNSYDKDVTEKLIGKSNILELTLADSDTIEVLHFTQEDKIQPIRIPGGNAELYPNIYTNEITIDRNGKITVLVYYGHDFDAEFTTTVSELRRHSTEEATWLELVSGNVTFYVSIYYIQLGGGNNNMSGEIVVRN